MAVKILGLKIQNGSKYPLQLVPYTDIQIQAYLSLRKALSYLCSRLTSNTQNV